MKKLLKIVGGTLFTLILLLLAIPLFISAETLKKEFTAQATKATGRAIDIKGKASLTLFPNIEVSLEDVTVGNPAGFKSPHLIHAKTLAAGASLRPLLAGNLNVTGITLHGADIRLEETASGAKNWEFAKAKTEEAPTEKKKGKASDAIKSFALGDISIKDSAVTYIQPGKTTKAEQINLTVQGADARGAFKVDGSLNYQGKPVKLKAQLSKLRDFLRSKASPAELALSLPNGSLKFNGKVQNDKEIAALGKIDLNAKDLPGLMKWATGKPAKLLPSAAKLVADIAVKGKKASLKHADAVVELPGGTAAFTGDLTVGDTVAANGKLNLDFSDVGAVHGWATGKAAPKNLPKRLTLTTNITTEGKKYTLKELTLDTGDLTATGGLTANMAGAVPAITGALKFGSLDISSFTKSAQAETGRGFMDAYAAQSAGWSREKLDLSGLRAVNADVTITADRFKNDKLEVSDIALHPQLSGGNLNLAINKASLYGGTATGTISAGAGGSVGANLTFAGIQIEPFLTALKGSSRLRGTTALSLNVRGSGASQYDIVANLNGNGVMKVTDGAIKGVNLAEFWREARKGFLFDSTSKSTDFSELGGSFTIVNGLLTNTDLAMKSPFLRVSGQGTVNLPPQTIHYRLVPSVVGTTKGQGGKDTSGLDIPLDITGPLANPSVTPDVSGMIQKQLENPEALKETIKDVKDGIKDMNSPEDIGRVLFGGEKKAAPAPAPVPAANTVPAVQSAPQPAAPEPSQEEQIIKGVGDLIKGF